jgi:hypothetical protein
LGAGAETNWPLGLILLCRRARDRLRIRGAPFRQRRLPGRALGCRDCCIDASTGGYAKEAKQVEINTEGGNLAGAVVYVARTEIGKAWGGRWMRRCQ